jgi:hypothetical protein
MRGRIFMALTLWAGKGIWEGWQIRKHYESCKFGESVLVDPDGVPYGPNDILELRKFKIFREEVLEQRNKKNIY